MGGGWALRARGVQDVAAGARSSPTRRLSEIHAPTVRSEYRAVLEASHATVSEHEKSR